MRSAGMRCRRTGRSRRRRRSITRPGAGLAVKQLTPARQQGLMRGKAAVFADSGALPSRGLKASAGVAGPGRAAARRRRAKLTILGNSTELARNQTKAPHTAPVQSAKLTCRLFRSAQRQRLAGNYGGMQNGRPRARKPHLQGPCTLGAKSAASCISHNSCKLLLKSTFAVCHQVEGALCAYYSQQRAATRCETAAAALRPLRYPSRRAAMGAADRQDMPGLTTTLIALKGTRIERRVNARG